MQQLKVYKCAICALPLPFLNKGRYEVDSRLIGNYMSGHQFASHSQRAQPKLFGALHALLIANIVLTKILHIVHIKAHIVTKPVRHKEACHASLKSLLDIPLHKTKGRETL